MGDLRHVRTDRLALDAVVAEDVPEHFTVLSDPGVWEHLPSGRHTDLARTAAGVALQVECWERTGLGVWTARLRNDLPAERAPGGLLVAAALDAAGV